ncbi:MAG TPA: signal peptidase II [Aliidongia sp.]|nr:signal peptidase II [Aliidongia sp.]
MAPAQLIRGLAAAILALAVDQASKFAVLAHFEGVPPEARDLPLLSFLDIRLIGNRGVTFGFFNEGTSGANALIFSVLAVIVIIVLIVALTKMRKWYNALALGLVVGGAVGNLIDRVRFGAVVDFLDFHVGSWHWYVFNGADAAICIGVAILLIDGLVTGSGSPKQTAL